MPNLQYQRGRSAEYYVKGKLETKGATLVLRSAGSHSPADLAAFLPSSREILLLQVKTSKKGVSESKVKNEMNTLSQFEGVWTVKAGYFIRTKQGWKTNIPV